MTLDGLTVDAWLRENAGDNTPASSDAPMEGPAAGTPRVVRLRAALVALAACGLGAVAALPALSAKVSCPPSGEGATYCHLEHNVLRAVVTFLLVAAAVVLVVRVVGGLPAFVRRVRREGLFPTPPSPTIYGDPLLLAATRIHG